MSTPTADRTGPDARSPVLRVTGGVDRSTVAAVNAVPVVRTGPTGSAADPLALATVEGRTAVVPATDAETLTGLAEGLAAGELPAVADAAVVDHDPETGALPAPDEGALSTGRRAVLGPCGWVEPLTPADYELVSPDRDAGAAPAGLVGRGRTDAANDEPLAETWETVRTSDGEPVVVVLANDADPRQTVDDTLLWAAPLSVLDGLAAVAEHVGADDAVLAVPETEADLQRHLAEAVDAAEDHLPVIPEVVAAPDEYRAGEPTAALEALEGADRVEPRLQPPGPARHGLYGRPTAVHSVRTVAQVQAALRAGDGAAGDAYDDGSDPGTRLFTVTGDVTAPAVVELGSGAALATVREAVELEETFRMACVGGVFGGLTADLDVAATAEAMRAADLGREGVVELLNDDRCALAEAGERISVAAKENSGRCVPGREGTTQLAELLRDVYEGRYDPETVRELARTMRRTSNCRLGATAPRPALTAMDRFESDLRAHADGRCPSGTCDNS